MERTWRAVTNCHSQIFDDRAERCEFGAVDCTKGQERLLADRLCTEKKLGAERNLGRTLARVSRSESGVFAAAGHQRNVLQSNSLCLSLWVRLVMEFQMWRASLRTFCWRVFESTSPWSSALLTLSGAFHDLYTVIFYNGSRLWCRHRSHPVVQSAQANTNQHKGLNPSQLGKPHAC